MIKVELFPISRAKEMKMDNQITMTTIDPLYVPTLKCTGQHCDTCIQWEPIPFQNGGGKCLATRKKPGSTKKARTVLTFPLDSDDQSLKSNGN